MASYHTSFTYNGLNSATDKNLIVAAFEPDDGLKDTFLSMDIISDDYYDGTKKYNYGSKYNTTATITITVIKNGKLDLTQLKNIRFTIDDLLEELRKKNIFDISMVQNAVVETDGTISVMLKAEYDTVKIKDLKIKKPENTFSSVVISDGEIIKKNLADCNTDINSFTLFLKSRNIKAKDIMLMTLDDNGKINVIRKDECI